MGGAGGATPSTPVCTLHIDSGDTGASEVAKANLLVRRKKVGVAVCHAARGWERRRPLHARLRARPTPEACPICDCYPWREALCRAQ